jgi:poly(3-hydroxybutyrate) depolymerase
MLSDDDLKAGGSAAEVSSKPSLLTRMRNRPLTSLAVIASIIVVIILAIALPVALSGNNDDGSSNGNSSGSHGSGSGKPSSTSSAAPHRPTMMGGCGTPHAGGYSNGRSTHNVNSSGNTRYYTIDVPTKYNDNRNEPWPLILDFHGANKDAANQYNNSQYFVEPRGDDYIVVYPEGMDGKWESASYAVKGADDLQFISDLLDQLDSNYCINSDRVYASGKSNGGGFIDMMACSDLGDSFAAFAMASAALYSDNSFRDKAVNKCEKSRAILESHGGKDSTVPYKGQSANKGTGGESPDIQDWLSWWARRDGCAKGEEPVVDNDHDGYNITSYSCNGYDNVVQGYYIPELNHCWPSADGNNSDSGARENGCSFRGLDFTSVVLDWFGRWNRTNAPQN